jgi:ketosteroid isomerase-like protein
VNSGDSVTAVGWAQGTVNATGARYRVAIVHHWKIAGGSITQVQFLIDNPVMLRALLAEVRA